MEQEQNLKFGVDAKDEVLKASIRRGCFIIRVEGVSFHVPFGEIELFLKMALSSKNNIEIYSSENSDLHLI